MNGKKVFCTVLAAMLLTLAIGAETAAAAGAPYDTRSQTIWGGSTKIKDAYLPLYTVTKFGDMELRTPSDLYIAADDTMYLADTGNARVIRAELDGTLLSVIGEGILKQPTGVFVNAEGRVYVADPQAKSVFLFDGAGELLHTYTRPTEASYGNSLDFKPNKVVSDNAGNVYIIADGNTNGVIQLSKEGDFFGYVGANDTTMGIGEIIRRFLSTEAQESQMKLSVPVSPNNLAIDYRGLVHTTTQGGAPDAIKKFNTAGHNMLDAMAVDSLVAAICIGPIGNIYTVSTDGYIAEYTTDGEFLFLFGGRDEGYNREGLFTSATGIALDSAGHLYILDSDSKGVTVFEPTEYADLVHTALGLHQGGRYVESQQPWESALQQNAKFILAYRGIGESYYKLGMYTESMEVFRKGYEYDGYSDAFWEVRNEWLMSNLTLIILLLLAFVIVVRVIKVTDRRFAWLGPVRRRWRQFMDIRLVNQVAFMKEVPKNPADAFYEIKYKNRVSITSSTILYVLFFAVFIADRYLSGYLFKYYMDGYYQFGQDFLLVFGVIALAVLCNNLICSISDGEGKLRDIYNAGAYCLMPYIMIKPFVILLSHGLTNNERFIIQLSNFVIVGAVAILLIIMVKEIQAYSLSKTIGCILLTLIAMALMMITLVIMFMLVNQVADFFSSIFREVYLRAS